MTFEQNVVNKLLQKSEKRKNAMNVCKNITKKCLDECFKRKF